MVSEVSLSVIVPVYNSSKTLESCFRSIYESSYKDFEVIVVDDCSTDNSIEIAQQFPCKIIRLGRNFGVARARNTGAAHAKGNLLLFVDSDIILQSDTIERIIGIFKSDPKVKIMGVAISKVPRRRGFGPKFVILYYYYYIHLWHQDEKRRRISCFFSECGAIYKDVFEENSGFDERYSGAGIEDYEFGNRINLKYTIWLYKGIQVFHYTPSVLGRCYTLFKRCFSYLSYLLKHPKFEINDPIVNKKEVISTFFTFVAVVNLFLSLFFPVLLYITIASLIIVIFFNFRFLIFLYREGRFLFMLYSIPALFLIYLSVSTGILLASFLYLFRKLKSCVVLKKFVPTLGNTKDTK